MERHWKRCHIFKMIVVHLIKKVVQHVEISNRFARNVLKLHKYHPYKIKLVQGAVGR